MSRTGRTIRSAKMNATTPPKLMPPFHSTAASGTLPIEQTNETIATIGPTSGPHSLASSGWSTRKKPCQNSSGTQAASAPAASRPTANSATVNCQPSSTARMTPSSITRLVEANWKAIAAVKSAPLRKIDRASATAAYEHDDEAAPSPVARRTDRGESSGSSRLISPLETTACTAPDSAKPRISAHRISQSIANARPSACPIGASTVLTPPRPVQLGAGQSPSRVQHSDTARAGRGAWSLADRPGGDGLGHDARQDGDHLWVELLPGAAVQLGQGLLAGHRGRVGALVGHRGEGVAGGDDP